MLLCGPKNRHKILTFRSEMTQKFVEERRRNIFHIMLVAIISSWSRFRGFESKKLTRPTALQCQATLSTRL